MRAGAALAALLAVLLALPAGAMMPERLAPAERISAAAAAVTQVKCGRKCQEKRWRHARTKQRRYGHHGRPHYGNHYRPHHHHHHNHHKDRDGNAAAVGIAAGLVGLAVGAAIMSSSTPNQDQFDRYYDQNAGANR